MSNRYLAQKLLQKRFQAKNTFVIIRSKSKRSHRQSLQPKDRTQKCSLNKNSDIVDNFLNPLISKLKLIYKNDNTPSCLNSLFIITSGRIHLKNKVVCRPEKECHWVDRNKIIFWYSKRYFVPNVTKIRFQIKPHIFFLFFYDGIQRNFNSKSAVSRFLGVSEIEN